MELATLERLKISHRLIMGKWCLQASSFIFERIFIKLAVTRTAIKSQTSSNSGWIESVTSQLCALVGELNFQYTNYDVSTFSRLFLIRFFLYLQVTRTCIKSRRSLTLGQIGPLTMELATLERLKFSHRLIMGKWCLQASSFIFDRIFFKLAGNQDSHKISDEFEFWLDRISHFGVTCPCGRIKFSIDILWNLQVQSTFQT